MRSIIRALCCLGLALGAGAVVRQALAKTRGAPADPRANQPTLPPGDPGVPAGEQLLQKVVRCRTASGQEVVRGTLVAEFEAGQKDAVDKLAEKIMKGGSGVWGQVPMPANPQVNAAEAKQLAQWVMTLK